MLPVTKLSLKPAILTKNIRNMQNFNQHIPIHLTDEYLDAHSGLIFITRFVRGMGICGT